jgi:hypothetical protein
MAMTMPHGVDAARSGPRAKRIRLTGKTVGVRSRIPSDIPIDDGHPPDREQMLAILGRVREAMARAWSILVHIRSPCPDGLWGGGDA